MSMMPKHFGLLLAIIATLLLVGVATHWLFNRPPPIDNVARQAGERLALQ
uniref:Uncharacterized protein n=1 Tax=Candidatus Kentrum sp. LFY TaxID=2126342 RepID=A0A450WCQ9_9GAMM|nr:MAG: hypothetical protein BECKLFY1418C_GA0070996_101120 [Candidatus Kentron sp. LFY]